MMTVQDNLHFAPGTVVVGKWHRHHYRLVRRLGSGAQGTVYLGKDGQRPVAVKLAKDRASLISEVHILQQFDKLQGDPLGPSLYDSDDWLTGGRTIGFCVMEYLAGTPLTTALKQKPFDWAPVYVSQLLRQLQQLHAVGYIFGDLKPENLMLMNPGHCVRCLDFGGATKIGRSVREYTEFYDRGYWGFGSRRAEPGYDLFACSMILIYAAAGQRFSRAQDPREQLLQHVKRQPQLAPYHKVLIKAMRGGYAHAGQMRADLLHVVMAGQTHSFVAAEDGHQRTFARRRRRRHSSWLSAWLVASVLITGYILFVMIYVM